MARSFTTTSQQYGALGGAVVTGYPCTFACWFKPATVAGTQVLIAISQKSNGALEGFRLYQFNNEPVAEVSHAGNSNVISTGRTVAGSWYHFCAVFSSSSSATIYLNGANSVNGNPGLTPSSLDTTTVGAVATAGAFASFANGSVAEAAIWNTSLNAGQVANLAAGQLPSQVAGGDLKAYWPLWGVDSPEPDISGNAQSLTLASSPPQSSHLGTVKVFLVQKSSVGHVAKTAPATTVSVSFASTPSAGNFVLAKFWGQEVSGLLANPAGSDNQGNAYALSYFLQDTILNGGEFCGEFLGKAVTASGTFGVTVTGSQLAGWDLALEEWYASPGMVLDQTSVASGSGTAPAPGNITTTGAPAVVSATFGSMDSSNPATVTGPGGVYVVNGTETNGGATGYTVGGAAYSTSGAAATYGPTWGADVSAAWVAGQADYLVGPAAGGASSASSSALSSSSKPLFSSSSAVAISSLSPGVSFSVSPSALPSPSAVPNLSSSPSLSAILSPGVSPGVISSASPSSRPSPSASASPSAAPSLSPSASVSAGPASASPSASPSVSPSASVSTSLAASPSASLSLSPSVSSSASPSAGVSVSPSVSVRLSASASPSFVVSPSPLASSSLLVSASPSALSSLAPSAFPSLSSLSLCPDVCGLRTNLLAWWGLHESAGQARQDATGNGNTAVEVSGTVPNTPTPGLIGAAANFPGGPIGVHHLVCPSPVVTAGPISVSAWALVAQNPLKPLDFIAQDAGFTLHQTGSTVRWSVGSGPCFYTVTAPGWYHFVGVNDGAGTSYLYVNGVLAVTASDVPAMGSATEVIIGNFGNNSAYVGQLYGIWGAMLSAAQVACLFNRGAANDYPFCSELPPPSSSQAPSSFSVSPAPIPSLSPSLAPAPSPSAFPSPSLVPAFSSVSAASSSSAAPPVPAFGAVILDTLYEAGLTADVVYFTSVLDTLHYAATPVDRARTP